MQYVLNALVIGALAIPAAIATALQPALAEQHDGVELAQADQDSPRSKPRSFGGPDGVSSQIDQSYEGADAVYEPEKGLKPYYDWKQRLQDEHGFAFGFTAYWLYQKASDSLGSDDDALGQIYRLQGNWTLLGRDTGHPGRIEWRFEYRDAIGSNLAPSQLGGAGGIGTAALNSGFGYSPNFDLDLSVFNWTQLFNDQTAGFAVGRLAFDAYLDAFPFQTFSKGFLNRSFVLNPTVGTTGIGARVMSIPNSRQASWMFGNRLRR